MKNPRARITLYDNWFVWNYDRFNMLVMMGRLDYSLERVEVSNFSNAEFAPLLRDRRGDVLAWFCFNPEMNFSVMQKPNQDTILNIESFDLKKPKSVAEEFIEKGGFYPYKLDEDFALALGEGYDEIIIPGYKQIVRASEISGHGLERVFGKIRYASFLIMYGRLKEEDAGNRAEERFKNI